MREHNNLNVILESIDSVTIIGNNIFMYNSNGKKHLIMYSIEELDIKIHPSVIKRISTGTEDYINKFHSASLYLMELFCYNNIDVSSVGLMGANTIGLLNN